MKELIEKYLNKIVSVDITRELSIKAKVIDLKTSYGKTRYKITPMAGEGEIWVENIHLKN